MKRFIVVLLIGTLFSFKAIFAIELTNYLPGGKNYLDSNNFQLNGSMLSSIQSFRVEGDTDYTFSLPGTDLLGDNIQVFMSGDGDYYDGPILDYQSCTVGPDEATCTFRTTVNEIMISLNISSDMMNLYYANYQMENMQLEEGVVATSYEAYIAPLVDSSSPEVNGAGAYVMSYTNTTDVQTIVSSHIIVYDEIDGDISDQVVIDSDLYTGNEGVVGDYDVEMHVSDSSGNTTYFTLTIMVKDEIDPVLSGPNELSIEVFSNVDINTIITENFIITDDYDGVIEPTIISDEYTGNENTIGAYPVTIKAKDLSNNVIIHSFMVSVVDLEAPTYSGTTVITSNLSNPITLGEIMNGITYSDNYDDMSNVTEVISTDDFTPSAHLPGTYNVVYEVRDSSDNILEVTLEITVVDDVLPVITGPSTYSYSYTDVPTIEDIKNEFVISDNVDNYTLDNLVILTDTFSTRSDDIGTSKIIFELSDSSGNKVTHILNISGIDDVAPVIYIDTYIVSLDVNSTFTEEDALRLLLNNNELPYDDYEITTLQGDTRLGLNHYRMQFKNKEGTIYEKEFHIKVVGDEATVNEDSMIRNVIVYSMVFLIIGVIYYKKR